VEIVELIERVVCVASSSRSPSGPRRRPPSSGRLRAGRSSSTGRQGLKDLPTEEEVYDEDLMAIVTDDATQTTPLYELDYLHVISGTGVVPSATVA